MSSGEDALLLPVERRNGEVPLGVCECLATGLTCQVLGGGGVSLNLTIDKLQISFIRRHIIILLVRKKKMSIPSAGWSTDDKLHARRAEGADVRRMTPVGVHAAFHADRLGARNDAATAAGTGGIRRGRLRRLLSRCISLTWNGNRLRDWQIAWPGWADSFPARLSSISGE